MPNPMSLTAKPASPMHLLPHELRVPDFGAQFGSRNLFTILNHQAAFTVINIDLPGRLLHNKEAGTRAFFDPVDGWANQLPGIQIDPTNPPARTQVHKMLQAKAYQPDRLFWITSYFEATCLENRPNNVDAMYGKYRILPRCFYVKDFTADFYNELLEKEGPGVNAELLAGSDFKFRESSKDSKKDAVLVDISSGKTLTRFNAEAIAKNAEKFGLSGEVGFERDHQQKLGINNASLYEVITIDDPDKYVKRVRAEVQRMHGVS